MRTLEGSNRVRNGLMGIIILVLVIGVGQSFASVPMLFATPTYYAQFSDTGGLNTGDKVRIAGVDVGVVRSPWRSTGDKVVIGYSLDGTQIGTDSRAAIRTDTILGRRNIEIEPRGSDALRANGILPLGQTTTPYQIYDAFFDVTKASVGLGHPDGEAIAERAVGDHRPDLSAPERRARRCGPVLRHHRQARRPDQASCWPTPTRSPASSATAASRSTSCWSTPRRCSARSTNATTRSACCSNASAVLRAGQGFHRRQPEPQPRARAAARRQRRAGRAQVRPRWTRCHHGRQFIASLGEAVASGPYFKVHAGQPAARPDPAAVRRRRVQEARHRPREVLAQRRSARIPVPRPERRAVPQRRSAAGAAVAGGHARESRPRGAGKGSPCSYTPPRRRSAAARQPAAVCGPDRRPVRRQPVRPQLRAARRGHVRRRTRTGRNRRPGVPAAAIPGQLPPDMPGAPAPLPPAPPGARTVPVGPLPPQPPDFTPGIAPLPPALTGPPPPPGPGPDAGPAGTPPLPGNPPFLPPLSQGQ